MSRGRNSEGCELDMTPMIDVVFQMIIFFIVTFKIDDNINEEIVLEFAKEGPVYDSDDPKTIVIEIDRRGWISINNLQLSEKSLRDIVFGRYKRLGSFPVMIRADRRTQHKDVRKVMDICTATGIWRIDFAAIKEKKAK
jgi:biopolymer transport protein ExbD